MYAVINTIPTDPVCTFTNRINTFDDSFKPTNNQNSELRGFMVQILQPAP